MKKFKVGVLGSSNFAVSKSCPWFQSSERFIVAGVASRNHNRSQAIANNFECKSYESYLDLVKSDDIDIVYIPLPNSHHYEWIVQSLENHKHVICEKPITMTQEEAEHSVELAGKMNLLLAENFSFTEHPRFKYLKRASKSHIIGDIRTIRSCFGIPKRNDNDIRYQESLGGGALMDLGVYPIRAVLEILGENIKVTSYSRVRHKILDIDLIGSISLIDENGTIGELSFSLDCHYQNHVEIWGSEGLLRAERIFSCPPDLSIPIAKSSGLSQEDIYFPPFHQFHAFLKKIAIGIDTNEYSDFRNDILSQARLLTGVLKNANV